MNEKANPNFPFSENIEIVSSIYNKSRSPLKFYRDSLRLAANSDIILSCGVGGAFFYPKIGARQVKIITNVDGLEHQRKKYCFIQKENGAL